MSNSLETLQVPLSVGFPRQEHWSRLPFLSPGNLPDSGIKFTSPALTGGFFTTEPPEQSIILSVWIKKQMCLFFFSLFLTHSFVLAIAYTLILAKRIKADLKSISVYK